MRKNTFYCILLFVISGLMLTSCKYNTKNLENPKWESNLLAPLVKTNLTMQNVVGDTSLKVESDNSLTYVYKKNLIDLPLGDYLQIPDTELVKYARLDSLKLSPKEIVYPYSLGAFARALIATGSAQNVILGATIINNHGSTVPSVPAVSYTSSGTTPWQEFNATTLFKSATLREGKLDIKLENHFPIDINNLQFEIRNKIDHAQIALINVPIVLEKDTGTYSERVDLAGKTVEGIMEGQIKAMNIPASTNVPIDTNKAMVVTLKAHDLQAEKATAIFPTQYLKNDRSFIVYDMGGSRITKIKVKSGKIRIKIESALQDSMFVLFSVPKAFKNGDSLVATTVVPPAPPNGIKIDSTVADISGYEINYTYDQSGGPNHTVNTFEQLFQVRIDSTGIERTIDISDSVKVIYGLYDIIPEYIEGWFIDKTVSIDPSSIDLSLFDKIQAGTFDFNTINMNMVVENSIGVNTNMYVGGKIKGVNTRTNTSVTLTSPIIDNSVLISGPTLSNKGQTITNSYNLNKTNSNVQAFLDNLPNKITYEGSAKINEGVPNTQLINHAYDFSRMKADLELNIPLNGVADNLTLMDTSAIDLTGGSGTTQISEGTLRMVIANKFPFSATIQAYFLDNITNQITDSLFKSTPGFADAGAVNSAGIVTTAKNTLLSSYVSKERMDRIRKSKKIIFKVVLNTVNGTKIYSDYGLDLKITGDFRYTSGN